MALSFPASPINGQVYSPGGGAADYVYNSTVGAWQVNGNSPSGGLKLAISATPPVAPIAGSQWWSSTDGKLYIYTGTAWTEATNETIPIATSSLLGAVKVGSGLAVDATGLLTNSAYNIGRNLLHNSLFRVQQRGAGAFTTTANTADRWLQELGTSTISTSIVALTDADRTAIGDEAAMYGLQCVVGGTAGAGDYAIIGQRLEGVNPTAGKTVTVSFWAKANTGTPKVGVGGLQSFGTGGSPSSLIAFTSTAVTLSTTWTRYSVSLAIPSVIGKTLGTTIGTDCAGLRFWMSSGATNNTVAGGIGVQSATFTYWGVQLEIGTTASPFEKPDMRYDLANCQRFYQIGSYAIDSYNGPGVNNNATISLTQTMRTSPTCGYSPTANVNCGAFTLSALSNSALLHQTTVTALGAFFASFTYTASADF